MHIVQLANLYGTASGGLRTVVDEVGREYARLGHRVTRIVPGDEDRHDADGAVEVVQLRAPIVPGMGGYRAVVDRRAVSRVLRSLTPDVIELADKTTLVGPARSLRSHGVPVVLVSHERIDGILRVRVPRVVPLGRVADAWNRRLAAQVDAVVCASSYAAQEWTRIGTRPHVVPLGVDHAVFRPPQFDVLPIVDQADPVLLCVGRLSTEKQPELAVETARELARRGVPARLVMVGDGPRRSDLVRRARGLDVVFQDHTRDRGALAAMMRRADVVLAPCGCETFGLVALEALACGTPVVAADRGALAEIVGDAGIVTHQSPVRFADAVEQILRRPRSTWREAASGRASFFSWSSTAAAMSGIFEALASSCLRNRGAA